MKDIMAIVPINGNVTLIDGENIRKESFEKITFIPETFTMLLKMKICDAFEFITDFYKS
jgi:ABC-2 type transport system ATP-binding protein